LSTQHTAPIAVSLGDPAGIGPELIIEAWARREEAGLPPFFVSGGAGLLAQAARQRGLDIALAAITDPSETQASFAHGLPVLGGEDAPYMPGNPTEDGARLAWGSLTGATKLVIDGQASALATAPIAKSELAKIGFGFPGQTEFLADACDLPERDAVMMLAGPTLRTVPLTVHCALAEVPALLSHDLICHKARIVATALARDFGIEHPRLAVAGLNPHAGEGGKFGDEEARIIAPAIAALREEGINATGPHPADAMFTPRARSQYHAALCMYHDQALVPLKALEFDEGVNVTLGLPIIRTSPDHGTAFDIAGKGIADPGAMIAAIRMAGEMAARRADHG
jgi:4-hydroxythreonine-4-phosphate dehydrogenase